MYLNISSLYLFNVHSDLFNIRHIIMDYVFTDNQLVIAKANEPTSSSSSSDSSS
jgi:hypothetical protein